MNHAVVVDASVLFKIVVREEFSDRAQALYADAFRVNQPIFAPPHWAAELTHALYRLVRRRGITLGEADQAMVQLLRFPVQVIATPELCRETFRFATTYGVDTYDSFYVVLAQMLEAQLWTDDRRLINLVGPFAPWVRWIGNYPMG